MKLNTLILGVLLLTGYVAKGEWTEIRGRMVAEGIPQVSLYEIVDGELKVIATVQVGANGVFGFLVTPAYEGFYALGGEQMNHSLYLKPGDRVNVELGKEALRFVGENSVENKKLGEWEQLAETVRLKSVHFGGRMSTYKDFFPEQEKLIKEAETFRSGIRTPNKAFNEALKRKTVCDQDYYALMFLYTPRAFHPKENEMPAYYQTVLAANKFTDDFLLTQPYGQRFLGLYVMRYQQENRKKPDMGETLDLFACERLKGEYLLSSLKGVKSYFQFQDMVATYGKYLTTPSQKERAEERQRKLFKEAPKGEAIDFTYPDLTGKMVSLSDFKGKVVVVDVWATWCGPCRQQIPYMKTLEKELHGKEVVFVGVSVDKKKDYEKWKQALKEEGLEGVQLFADGFGKIAKDYGITGIPRFMVFDKEGKAVDIQAPKPSQPALKKMIEAELQK